jgi:hypothetical protein
MEIDVNGRIELSAEEDTAGEDTLAAERSPSDGAIMLDACMPVLICQHAC